MISIITYVVSMTVVFGLLGRLLVRQRAVSVTLLLIGVIQSGARSL